jgi:mycoketide-CoA synthase
MARAGLAAMPTHHALQLFDTCLTKEAPHLIPARLDLGALRAHSTHGGLPALFSGLIHHNSRRHVEGDINAARSKTALAQRLHGLPEHEQHTVLRQLVCTHIATVLGTPTPEDIDPDRAFTNLGFDSLTAVELRNRLKTATGLNLSPTIIFDYPTPTTLADHLTSQIAPERPTSGSAQSEEMTVRNALHEIPLSVLRDAGLLNPLLALANPNGANRRGSETAESIDEMDVETLLRHVTGNPAS